MVGRRFRFESRPESAQVGLLHEGRDPLAKGCAYCTKAPPTRSTPNPPPVAPHPRAVHPDKAGIRHSDRACPLRQTEAAALPIRQTHPTGVSDVMTSETLRSHETTQRVKGATARPNLRPRGASSRRGLAGLSIGAHAPELLRNQRSLGGSPGARPDGVWVSMVLTSTPHRCCTPKKDRRISTIPSGCFDGRLGSVGAVDTGPRRSESPWVLPQSPAPFSQVLLHRSRARSLRRVQVVMVGRRFRFESRLE